VDPADQCGRARVRCRPDLFALHNGLALAGIEVDRKVLADLAVHEPEAFAAIAQKAKAALPA